MPVCEYWQSLLDPESFYAVELTGVTVTGCSSRLFESDIQQHPPEYWALWRNENSLEWLQNHMTDFVPVK